MITQLAEQCFAFRNPEKLRSNAGFVVGDEAVILIDSLMTIDIAQSLRDGIEETCGLPVNTVVNTHFHGDHVFGNSLFTPPALVVSHEQTRQVLAAEGQGYVETFIDHYHRHRPQVAERIRQSVVALPACTFHDELTLYAGDTEVHLIHVGPAHTSGDVIAYVPSTGVVYAGDVVFNRIHPFFMEATLDGSIRALERLSDLDVSTIVPGHGDVSDSSVLAAMLDYFRELRDRIIDSIGTGANVEETIDEVVGSLRPDWPAEERLPDTVRRAFQQINDRPSAV